jgi:hypothetical protein
MLLDIATTVYTDENYTHQKIVHRITIVRYIMHSIYRLIEALTTSVCVNLAFNLTIIFISNALEVV